MHIIDRIYAIILSFIFLFLTICNVLAIHNIANTLHKLLNCRFYLFGVPIFFLVSYVYVF